MSGRTYEFTDEELRSMSEEQLIYALTQAYAVAEQFEPLRGPEMFPDYHEHNELQDRINGDGSRLSEEIVRRTVPPWKPRLWGAKGPKIDCLGWMVWPEEAGWQHIVWRDADVDEPGGYYWGGEPVGETGAQGITHWMPIPAAPGAES